jgi:hypothetical protein
VPLVECVLTVANASIASEVRRLARMDEEDTSGGTVRLLARLRGPIGEGGSVVDFVSGCASSAWRIGQQCTRRRKPYQMKVRYDEHGKGDKHNVP